MHDINLSKIREALRSLPSDHDASGEHTPLPNEIFAPEQHANALDPYTSIVVGARGTGKSFWAGVLAQEETRNVAAESYPNLGLERLIVASGYSGLGNSKTLEYLVPKGQEKELAFNFWQSSIIKSIEDVMNPNRKRPLKIANLMDKYKDPEEVDYYFNKIDAVLKNKGKLLLVTFDALDTLAKEWGRSTLLLDALFEVVWSLRVRKNINAKVFIRPEQLNDESLRFVEIPKLRSSRVELEWTQVELYGLLFSRLAYEAKNTEFKKLTKILGCPFKDLSYSNRRNWSLISDIEIQKEMMSVFAGPYMGKNYKKGGTYDWPYKHLADAHGKVTPRSFIKLFVEASKHATLSNESVISPEGIRHGLREASKVRVDQLGIEYNWVRRALAPLAGQRVPCPVTEIFSRWDETDTIKQILAAATDPETGFLPPFPPRIKTDKYQALAEAMEKIGLIEYRSDGRVDIPDLFRVAALMLKKGGTAPVKR